MDDSAGIIIIIMMFAAIFVTGIGVHNSIRKDAIENCIQAHSDWTVTQANNYCNTVIREGKLP